MSKFLCRATALLALLGSCAAYGQPWPSKPITMVVGYPPGGDVDVLTRVYAEKLSIQLGTPVVVENRPGASGTIADTYVARAPADGYTLLQAVSTFVIAPHVFRFLAGRAYDPVKDFTPIIQESRAPLVLSTSSANGITSLADLVKQEKAGKQFSYASPGLGTPMHLVGEQFNKAANVQFLHVPYKGTGPLVADALAGHVTLGWTGPTAVVPYMKGGKLKALAVTTLERSEFLPDVPTFAEAGFPGIHFTAWQGVLGPKNMPSAVVQKLNLALNEVMRTPEVQATLKSLGSEAVGGSPEAFRATIARDYQQLGALVREFDIKLE